MNKIKKMNKKRLKMKIKFMIKRKALIKGEIRMMGIMKDQEQDHHTQECAKPFKEITPWTIFLVISRKVVTTRSHVAAFYQHYSFVYSLEPFMVEDALCDPDWVVTMQEELNNFKRIDV
jgi:hypothetical protein